MIRFFILCIFMVNSLTIAVVHAQAIPSARELFAKMKKSIDTVRTVSYQLQYRNVNSGQEDSVFWSNSKTWVKRVPDDSIFAAHFHVRQQSRNGEADYYYDGFNAMDIYHRHLNKGLDQTITVIEPYRLSNGYNAVQSRTTARGFSEDLLAKELNTYWLPYIDSMNVKDGKDEWIIEWTKRDPAEDFVAYTQLALDKQHCLLKRVLQHSVWHSVPMKQDVFLTHLQVNRPEDLDSVYLKENYPSYTIKWDRKNMSARDTVQVSLEGTQALPFYYETTGGKKIPLLPPKGSYLLIDFWETWCGYCFLAMPRMKELLQKYAARGLRVVGVVTENKAQVRKIVQQQAFPYPTVFADEKIVKAYRLEGRPRYLLIGGNGKILVDATGSLDRVEQLLSQHLR